MGFFRVTSSEAFSNGIVGFTEYLEYNEEENDQDKTVNVVESFSRLHMTSSCLSSRLRCCNRDDLVWGNRKYQTFFNPLFAWIFIKGGITMKALYIAAIQVVFEGSTVLNDIPGECSKLKYSNLDSKEPDQGSPPRRLFQSDRILQAGPYIEYVLSLL